MLLVIDVGNTNIVLGALDGTAVVHQWRVSTSGRTTDEFGMLLLQLLGHQGIAPDDVAGVAVSCVVPSVLYSIEKACRRYLETEPVVVGRIKTGMAVRTDNPREVGADRVVNAVAALERVGHGPLVVVDFGTATTFDCVNDKGHYVGGAIAPGFQISSDALFSRTAMLPRIELEKPQKVIGTNTRHSMQSGLYWGYVGLVEALARRTKEELGGGAIPCIATGGMANLVGSSCREIDEVVDDLTLQGLRILWERNA